ncbi:MAG: cytochrome c3 family protein, partial [Planctomycetaceae bacterium]|nr:cytochrome c3 family protein [Planctomycetaceae bacterium]
MSKNEFTSIIFPGMPVPEPPDWRPFFRLIIGVIFGFVFVLFIGFLVYETVMDAAGKPLWLNGVELVKRQTTPPTKDEIDAQFSLISPLPNSRLSKGNITIICVWQPDPFTQLHSQSGKLLPPYEPELLVDGRRVEWLVNYGASWLVQVDLAAGLHSLQVSNVIMEFIIDSPIGDNSTDGLSAKSNERKKIGDASTNDSQTDYDFKIKRALLPVMRSHQFVDDMDKCTICHEIVVNKDKVITSAVQQRIIKPVNGASACVDCHGKSKIHTAHGNRLDIWENCSKCHALHGTTVQV